MEAIKFFSDGDNALNYLANIRWPKGVVCPYCGDKGATLLKTRKIWKCKTKDCRKQFSIKVGTIFEDSAIKLDKWMTAMWMLANCKNGVSSHELARTLGVTQKSAWFMLQRLRLALQENSEVRLSGEVEADESFIGGKARNMHSDKRKQRIHGRGPEGKTIVMGLLERHGKVRTAVVEDSSQA